MAKINTAIRLKPETIERYRQHINTLDGEHTVSEYMRWVLETYISKEFRGGDYEKTN